MNIVDNREMLDEELHRNTVAALAADARRAAVSAHARLASETAPAAQSCDGSAPAGADSEAATRS